MKKDELKFVISWLNEQVGFTNKFVVKAYQTKKRGKEMQYEAMKNAFIDCLDYLPSMKSKIRYYDHQVVKNGYCLGAEPYSYMSFVREILSRYEYYKTIIS
ncbi:MAG: hypothetical protein JKY42_06330 [Flavobacteriales bacterium]|nr:hypothetical protein [Flavobacteriales bacterium]